MRLQQRLHQPLRPPLEKQCEESFAQCPRSERPIDEERLPRSGGQRDHTAPAAQKGVPGKSPTPSHRQDDAHMPGLPIVPDNTRWDREPIRTHTGVRNRSIAHTRTVGTGVDIAIADHPPPGEGLIGCVIH